MSALCALLSIQWSDIDAIEDGAMCRSQIGIFVTTTTSKSLASCSDPRQVAFDGGSKIGYPSRAVVFLIAFPNPVLSSLLD